jgi:hypothetical protein
MVIPKAQTNKTHKKKYEPWIWQLIKYKKNDEIKYEKAATDTSFSEFVYKELFLRSSKVHFKILSSIWVVGCGSWEELEEFSLCTFCISLFVVI